MTLNNFFARLTMAVLTAVALIGCEKGNKEGEPAPDPNDQTVYSVYQKVEIEISEDLKEIADIKFVGYDATGESIVFGVPHATGEIQEFTTPIEQATQPFVVALKSSLKDDYTAGTYDITAYAKITIEFRNKAGYIIGEAMGLEVINENTLGLEVNDESAELKGLLNGKLYQKSVLINKNSDGSYSLQEVYVN